jgi:arsenate reductase (thioredoxin)
MTGRSTTFDNYSRSIFAEAYTNAKHPDRLQAFSAGSHPKTEIHPLTLEYLKDVGIPTDRLRTKSWNEFATHVPPRCSKFWLRIGDF